MAKARLRRIHLERLPRADKSDAEHFFGTIHKSNTPRPETIASDIQDAIEVTPHQWWKYVTSHDVVRESDTQR